MSRNKDERKYLNKEISKIGKMSKLIKKEGWC